ncbi:MAG: PASTA domain-containing protein [Flavobacteriales bacterium]|nr:PASTA domain-containing protein [Flavobacteriales bacterium]MCB9166106.1 PASTA domain-containing protein [Flavobacteriales bacterium]
MAKKPTRSLRPLVLLLPLLVAALLLFMGWSWLKSYTRHGQAVRIPDLTGLSLAEADALLGERGLDVMVIDSVYSDEAPKGTVVDQDPDQGLDVKPGRKIYIVLNATQPKMLNMPHLVDLSKRQAISVLDIIGLKVKDLRYRPDACVDCVLEQLYQGAPIAPETRIRRGEAVTLVLGSGLSGERVPVPDMTGLTLAELAAVLNMASLNVGVVAECRGCNTSVDSALARVYRQSPAPGTNSWIAMGGLIDVWLNADTTGLRPKARPNDTLTIENDQDGANAY